MRLWNYEKSPRLIAAESVALRAAVRQPAVHYASCPPLLLARRRCSNARSSAAECVHTAKGQGSARGGETHALLEVEELRERSREESGRVEEKTAQDNEVKVCGGRRARRQQK